MCQTDLCDSSLYGRGFYSALTLLSARDFSALIHGNETRFCAAIKARFGKWDQKTRKPFTMYESHSPGGDLRNREVMFAIEDSPAEESARANAIANGI